MIGAAETVIAKDAVYIEGVIGSPGVLWVGGVVWYYICNIFQVHLDDVWWGYGVKFCGISEGAGIVCLEGGDVKGVGIGCLVGG